jgi:hypothetical protein
MQPQPPVYWVEADEEATLLAPDAGTTLGRRSLLAYLLLGRTVIAHPADFWQSRRSNDLVLDLQAQPRLRDAIQLHLGDSPTVRDYITERMGKLRRDMASSQTNRELLQYEQYGPLLTSQSDQLDDVFTRSGATFPTRESRDKKFRKLIQQDLRSEIPFGPHLGPCIRHGLHRREADRAIKTLESLCHDGRRFVSIDGIMSRLHDARCERGMLNSIFERLQILHWQSRREGTVEVPILSRAIERRLDSADPQVFWNAVEGLVGPELQRALMTLPWAVAVYMADELRSDSLWKRFIDTYHVIVETVEQDHIEIAESIVASKTAASFPKFRHILWRTRPDKWTVLSWVCHAGSWFVGIPHGVGLVLKVGSGLAAGRKVIDHVKRVVDAFHASERHVIAGRIRLLIKDATRTH